MVTVITKTIGPTGRDYTTFTLAEAAVESIATAEFGGTNLVTADGAIVFEADAGTYSESGTVFILSSLTTDETRQVTYKPASGAEHGGAESAGVIVQPSTGATPFDVRDNFTALDGLVLKGTSVSANGVQTGSGTAVGVSIKNCVVVAGAYPLTLYGGGSVSDPIRVENCVARTTGNVPAVRALGLSRALYADLINCTVRDGQTSVEVNAHTHDATVNLLNILALDASANTYVAGTGSGTLTVTGSNNFGGATNPFPVAIQGSPYPITATTSFSTPLGSGDYAVYMGATGALADVTGNDVWQQGVGPGSNSDVPTTDINGVARSGASCNPGAFEADGFVAPTVLTRTIGPTGRDYTTFALAEADTSNIGTSGDLTFENEAIVFEADDTTFALAGILTLANTALVTDATRNVSYTAASGTPLVTYASTSRAISMYDPYTRWSGIDVQTSTARAIMIFAATTAHGSTATMTIENCTLTAPSNTAIQCDKTGLGMAMGTSSEPIVVQNVVSKSRTAVGLYVAGSGHTTGAHMRVVNCTHLLNSTSPGNVWNWGLSGGMPDASFKIINCANLASDTSNDANITGGGCDVSGSTNNIGNAAASSSSFRFENIGGGIGAQYTPSTAYDPGAGDFALYVGKNGALLDSPNNDVINGGVGPASNSNVPTTDILGDTRSGTTTNPGAFALAQATAVLTRTIGPVGRDYATFTAAEADVENIGGSADLVFENERIEFLADAGTYSESVTISSSLTTDATRQVTYKPAAGSEHGGVIDGGVLITSTSSPSNNTLALGDNFTKLSGLGIQSIGQTEAIQPFAHGYTIDSCVIESDSASTRCLWVSWNPTSPPANAVNTVANNLFINGFVSLWHNGGSDGVVFDLINNTHAGLVPTRNWDIYHVSDTTYNAVNNLVLNSAVSGFGVWLDQGGGGVATVTGSNNFGGSFGPFPAALQGSPYPITPTTNTTPGFGDYAIYEPGTGALVVVADNAALGGGVGPAANADVPVLDINGVQRIGGGCDPGAFEGVRSRSLDVWDVVTATHNTPGTFGEMMQQVYLLTRTAAAGRIV